MKGRSVSRLSVLFMVLGITATLSGAAAQTCPNGGTTVYAHVVAIDQPIMVNRLGANLPGGMIFALARDVCAGSTTATDDQTVCDASAPGITPGTVRLKPYKRPRPIVLRVNQGQCLKIGFTNLLTPTAPASYVQPSTRNASVHVQGLELVNTTTCGGSGTGPMCNDGSWVGRNGASDLASSGLVPPAVQLDPANPQITYTLYAANEGAFLLYSTADTFTESGTPSNPGSGAGDGGQLAFGLFGAVHVEPAGAEWYRSQVTAEDLQAARQLPPSQYGQPRINYAAVYTHSTSDPCFKAGTCRVGPVLAMTCGKTANPAYQCTQPNEIVHSDLTAMITGPGAGRFPEERPESPTMKSSYSLPDRQEPFREFTIIYHEMFNIAQAFPDYYNNPNATATRNGEGQDQFGINYGMAGIGSEVLANRFNVGPMANCPTCKFEEFFLTSWAVGDPAMVVDKPATDLCTPQGTTGAYTCGVCPDKKTACDPGKPSTCPNQGACTRQVATKAFFPDDPSNVYHSYIADHTKFRILHGGSDLHHVHHQHAHQWLHSPDTSNGDYLDSQSIGPGSAFTLEMTYNASGNVNQTVGDSIFHCHFYPHFAGGMWSLWRVHDVYETGTELDAEGRPKTGAIPSIGTVTVARALPDGEIAAGTPIPAVVPLPTLPMPPMPAKVLLAKEATEVWVCNTDAKEATDCRSNLLPADGKTDPKKWKNPGFPFFIPGIGGQRAPHPPLDFAKNDDGTLMDGGLPRHLVRACEGSPSDCAEIAPVTDFTDFSKTLIKVNAFELPEDGTFIEQVAMSAHEQRLVDSVTPEGNAWTVNAYDPPNRRPAQFILNGMPRQPGAPYADPCIEYDLDGGRPKWHAIRRYMAADIQLDVTFNKEGWHYPQQRMLSLWGDVKDYLSGAKPPEPFFFRANSGDCIEYILANLVPNVYELDDFQVRTPTDIIGQHIHLVKFDVTSSDGATNGWNYEDGTFAPNEVMERIAAINAGGGLSPDSTGQGQRTKRTAKPLAFFGPGPGGQWMGAQATIQRWYTDRLFDGTIQKPGVDRTLRTVFTHDHFGPSTHQQAGLYAGLVIEPEGSVWYFNESGPEARPFGGDDSKGQPLPATRFDGGPTSWQAVIETPDIPGQSTKMDSFREFLLEFQDTTLTYEKFAITAPANAGFCSDTGKSCTPATVSKPATGCSTGGVCYAYGFCSVTVTQACTTDPVANYVCGTCENGKCQNNPQITCGGAGTVIATAAQVCGGSNQTCNLVAGIPSSAWGTKPLDVNNPQAPGDNVELITLSNATNSFSVNYRSEPLFQRIDSSSGSNQGQPVSGTAGDLSYAYMSIARPNLPCAYPNNKNCDPYPKPLTPGVGANDPFTPLLRAYAGDDVQIRTLVGAHINPHNFTVHGVKWLAEPSFVDSGWRNSQVMGISEHFEEIFKLSALSNTGTLPATADYLYMPGAAAIEQAGGSWGLMRAYGSKQPDLRPLPQNQTVATAPVCPTDAFMRQYQVVALTAKQALPGGQLVYNTRGPIADPHAVLYFQLQDLNCPDNQPSTQCKAKAGNPEPLVLRANAGECLKVTLYNMIDPTNLGPGASWPVTPSTCGPVNKDTSTNCNSNTSVNVGLHPQLVSFDVTTSSGFNAGNNPVQTVAPGQSNSKNPYIWYAGNVDPKAPAGRQHIPIEFGGANLLPSDTLNHYQYGLFGALVIEPEGSGCVGADGSMHPIETCTRTTAHIKGQRGSFKELVLIVQDGLQGPAGTGTGTQYFQLQTAWLGGDNFNALNYRSEPLFLPGPNPQLNVRTCSSSSDFSCVLSSTAAQCCTSFNSNGNCTSSVTCGDAQTPILEACAGEEVRIRVLHGGGINTNQVFELYGHSWQEQPYVSRGRGCKPTPTTHTNLYSSSSIGTVNGCDPLERDTYSEYQGARMGHGPSNHFDVLIPSAGGVNKVPGDYLYRSYPADHFRLGFWGILRVNACGARASAGAGAGAGAAEGGGR